MSIKEELSQSRREYLKSQKSQITLTEAATRFKNESLEPLFRKYHEESPDIKELIITIFMKEKVKGWQKKCFIYKGEKEERENYMESICGFTIDFDKGISFDTEKVLNAATEVPGDITGRKGDKMWIFTLSLDD